MYHVLRTRDQKWKLNHLSAENRFSPLPHERWLKVLSFKKRSSISIRIFYPQSYWLAMEILQMYSYFLGRYRYILCTRGITHNCVRFYQIRDINWIIERKHNGEFSIHICVIISVSADNLPMSMYHWVHIHMHLHICESNSKHRAHLYTTLLAMAIELLM